jgi:Ca-activated chloride channel family protein
MRRFFLVLPLLACVASLAYVYLVFDGEKKRLWISADKEAQVLEASGKKEQALKTYQDMLSVGNIYYREGEFKKALSFYERSSSKEAFYNRANALVMLGKYNEAVSNYELALKADPYYKQAKENMDIAKARQAELDKYKNNAQHMADERADEIKYDNKGEKGVDYEDSAVNQGVINNTWLDRLETSPQKFLHAKFRYQYEEQKRVQK